MKNTCLKHYIIAIKHYIIADAKLPYDYCKFSDCNYCDCLGECPVWKK